MTTSIIRFTTDRDAVGFDAVADLYGSVGFGTARQYKEDKRYEAAFHSPGSYVFLAIADGERLVGMARAFSDDRICTWIAEICVHPACQSRGIGRQISLSFATVALRASKQSMPANSPANSFIVPSSFITFTCGRLWR